MSESAVTIEIFGDVDDIANKLTLVDKNIQSLGTSTSKVGLKMATSISKAGNSFGTLSASTSQASTKTTGSVLKIDKVLQDLSTSTSKVGLKMAASVSKAGESFGDLGTKAKSGGDKATKSVGGISKKVTLVDKTLQGLSASTKKVGTKIASSISKAGKSFSILGTKAKSGGDKATRAVDRTEKEVKQLKRTTDRTGNSMASSFKKIIISVGLLTAAFFAARGAARIFGRGIKEAADAEVLKVQFEAILGSADAAEKRFDELAVFAETTPFELLEIGKASKVLETLTKGALSTGDGLRLVGDVAAASGEPFNELSVQVGRAFAALQSGTKAGESIARLVELGLISNDTRLEINKLQAEGKKGEEVWGVMEKALGKFGGAMEKLSKTWTGMLSTLKDNISKAFREFGNPIIDALKPLLGSAIGLVDSLVPKAKAAGEFVGRMITKLVAVIRKMVELFQSGELSAIAIAALILAGKTFINFLFSSLITIFKKSMEFNIKLWSFLITNIGKGIRSAFTSILPIIIGIKDKLVAGVKLAALFFRVGIVGAAKKVLDLLADVPVIGGAFKGKAEAAGKALATTQQAMVEQMAILSKSLIDSNKPSIFAKLKDAIKGAIESGKLFDTSKELAILKGAFADSIGTAEKAVLTAKAAADAEKAAAGKTAKEIEANKAKAKDAADVKKAADAKQAAKIAAAKKATADVKKANKEEAAAKKVKSGLTVATSLTAIGGGGGRFSGGLSNEFQKQLAAAKRQEDELKKLNKTVEDKVLLIEVNK